MPGSVGALPLFECEPLDRGEKNLVDSNGLSMAIRGEVDGEGPWVMCEKDGSVLRISGELTW